MSTTDTATPHDEILSGLTEEERAALSAPDDDDQDDTNGGDDGQQDKGGTDDGAAAAAGDAGAAAAPANGDQAAAPAADEQGAAAGQPPQQAPIFIAEAPADAEEKLADLKSKKDDVIARFDDGDITAKEMQQELDSLNKQERDIERALDKAQIAADMEAQRQKNQWDNDCNSFLDKHKEYTGEANKELFAQLNETVIAYAKMPRNAGLSGPELLERAHRAVMAERGTPVAEQRTTQEQGKPAKQQAPTVPKPATAPSLHSLPAAQQNDAGEGRFAALRGLNGFELENALGKMSESDREAFMRESD